MKSSVLLSTAAILSFGLSLPAQQATPATPPVDATAPTAATPLADETPRPAVPNTLMDGTAVKLRLSETISSESAHTGQQVPFEVTEDVVVQGVTVLPKGSPAIATVTNAEPKKRMGRGGKLDVNVDSARLTDGEKIQLRAVKGDKGGGHVGAMTGAIVATSIVFFPAAPLFLLMHGKDITIPKGTEVTAFVQGDTRLEMAKFQPGAAPVVPGAPAAVNPAVASLFVDSSVPGADIEVDDAFVGSTPSSVSVTPGSHSIAVKKKGYAAWSRKMNVTGGGAKVMAELEPVK